MHLTDRGGGEGLGLELGEVLRHVLAQLLLEHRRDLLPRHRRSGGPQLAQLLLIHLGVLGRQELGVDERGELADLHRRPLHLAERSHHLQRGLEMARFQLLLGLCFRAGDARGLGARVFGGLASESRAELCRAAQAALRDLHLVGHGRRVARHGWIMGTSLSSAAAWHPTAQP